MTETENWLCELRRGCSIRGYNPVAFLAVRLLESGGNLSGSYQTDIPGRSKQSFGALQWTVSGAEILSSDKRRETAEAQYDLIKSLNRLQQLAYIFLYYDAWQKSSALFPVDFNDQNLWHYHITLSPGRSIDYPQKNNPTVRQIVQGNGAVGKNFRSCLILAEKMLNGTAPVPRDSPTPQPFNLRGTSGLISAAAHLKKWGSEYVNPATCPVAPYKQKATKPASPPVTKTALSKPTVKQVSPPTLPIPQNLPTALPKTAGGKGTKSIDELFPLKMTFKIPEYPRLVFLKPGDIIILPESAVYRDWLVTQVNRTFNQGMNLLDITAVRTLNQKPFVQPKLLSYKPAETMDYYWLL